MVRVGADFSAGTKQSKKASGSVVTMMSRINRATTKLEGTCSRMKKALGTVGTALGVGFGAAAVVSAAKAAAQAYNEVQENNAALAQVMKNTMAASKAEYQSILDLCDAQQKLGVIDGEVAKAGAVELSTYLGRAASLKKLLPVMNDMLAQQYGLNATSENAVNIATMLGKVMNGQTGALSRYGYAFDEAQAAVLKYGDEAQRAAVLAQVVEESVGGMNEALAQTPSGRLRQVQFALGDIQEQFGRAVMTLATAFLPLLNAVAAILARIAAAANRAAQAIANVFGAKLKTAADAAGGLGQITGGAQDAADAVDGVGDAAEIAAKKLGLMSWDKLNVLSKSGAAAAADTERPPLAGRYDVQWDTSGADEMAESCTWLEKILQRLKKTADRMDFSRLKAGWDRLKESAAGLGRTLIDGLGWAYDHVLEPLAVWTVNVAAPAAVNLLADALYGLSAILKALGPAVSWFGTYVVQPMITALEKLAAFVAGRAGNAFRAVGDFFNGKTIDISQLYKDIGSIGDVLGLNALRMMGDLGRLMDKWGALKSFVQKCCDAMQSAIEGLQSVLEDAASWLNKLTGKEKGGYGGGFGGSRYGGTESASVSRDEAARRGWSILLRRLNPGIGALPHFADGGILRSAGLFTANENGVPELVGRMGSHAAVANGGQIQEGISDAVLEALLGTGLIGMLRDLVRYNRITAEKDFTLGAPSAEAGRWASRSMDAYDRVRG